MNGGINGLISTHIHDATCSCARQMIKTTHTFLKETNYHEQRLAMNTEKNYTDYETVRKFPTKRLGSPFMEGAFRVSKLLQSNVLLAKRIVEIKDLRST